MNLFIKNTLANFSNSFVTAGLGFISIPILIRLLGSESYGVVAIYATIQAAVLVFDLGWTALNGRQIARRRSDSINGEEFEDYFKSVQLIFYTTVVLLLGLGFYFSEEFAGYLLTEKFDITELSYYLNIMFLTAGLRFVITLYRSTLAAYERQVEASVVNIFFITVRQLIPLLIMYVFSYGLEFYIWWQCAATLLEYVYYTRTVTFSTGFSSYSFLLGASFNPLKQVYKFSGTIAITSGLWIITSQADRFLIVSNFSLTQFGQYVPIVTVASLIQLFAHPIATALRPKLNIAYQSTERAESDALLLTTTNMIACLTIPLATVIYFGAETIVSLMLGVVEGSQLEVLAQLLRLLTISNMIVSVSAVLYYYQVATGELRWHLIGAVAQPIILLPVLYILISQYGIIGAGYGFLVSSGLFFLFFIPIFKSLGFSKIFVWLSNLAVLVTFVWIETFFVNLFFDNLTLLDEREIIKLLLLGFNSALASLFGFVLVSSESYGFKAPISAIRDEINRIR